MITACCALIAFSYALTPAAQDAVTTTEQPSLSGGQPAAPPGTSQRARRSRSAEQESTVDDVLNEARRSKELNKDRHDALRRDTDKLLALATELKDHVDHSNENTLSLQVIRKAEEIEKLARSVKNKMKGH